MNNGISISRWDAVEFLECQEDIDVYLEVAFESGEPDLILKALENAARAMCKIGDKNKAIDINSDSQLKGCNNDNPSLQELTTVIDNLGYRLTVVPKDKKHLVSATEVQYVK